MRAGTNKSLYKKFQNKFIADVPATEKKFRAKMVHFFYNLPNSVTCPLFSGVRKMELYIFKISNLSLRIVDF